MEELLKKSNINDSKIRKYIFTITAEELSKLSEPCYFPAIKKYYYELLNMSELTEKDLSIHVSKFYYGTPASKWKFHTDIITNFYIFLMYYFLKNNDYLAYNSMMTFYSIRNYANLMRKHWPKFCKEEYFRYALEKLVRNHLFSREKTIAGGLFYLSKELRSRYTSYIEKGNLEGITKFITEARHRVSQSVKSFAETYYRIEKEGISIMPRDEDNENKYQQQTLSTTTKIVEDAVKLLVVYKYVDKKANDIAQNLSKCNRYVAREITEKIVNPKYTDNIKISLNLFVKDLKNIDDICGPGYFKYVKSKLSGKRQSSQMTFKKQIIILTKKLLDDTGNTQKYNTSERQTSYSVVIFVSYYVTGVLRNSIC